VAALGCGYQCLIKKAGLCLAGVLLSASSPALLAQQPSEPGPPRFNLTPLLGYRTPMSFQIEPHVSGTNPRVVFDADPSYGFAFGGHINDEDVVEFRWTRQDSHIHAEDVPGVNFRQRVTLNQFHGDFTHEYFRADWRKWARPFIMGSVGATHLSAGVGNHFTRFSFGIGGGVKLFSGRHFGLRIQAEWLPILVTSDAAFICGAGCVVHISGDVANQAEFVAGPIFRF
jgi:hypothetical protein